MNRPERFSDTLDRLRLAAENAADNAAENASENAAGVSEKSLTLEQVITLFGPKGHVLLILFLDLPFCQPIPLPGVSTAVGVCMMLVAYFMILDKPPWLPKRLAKTSIDKKFLIQVTVRLESIMKRLERIVKPRGRAYFQRPSTRVTSGIILCAHALLLSLPLPIPLSNFFPALVLFLISLGTLEEDVVVLSFGYVAVIVCMMFFTALVLLPYFGFKALS